MRTRGFVLLCVVTALTLGGCSERVVATANDTVLIIAEDIDRTAAIPTASLHYLLATPMPISDEAEDAQNLVRSMRYEAVFDCARRAWGSRVHELTMADGRVTATRTPEPRYEPFAKGSTGELAFLAVCDPAFATAHSTRRPRRSIEKDYLGRTGQGRPGD